MNMNIKVNGESFKIETVVRIETGKEIIFMSNNQIDNNGLVLHCGELQTNSITNISDEEWTLAKHELRNALFENIKPINFTLNAYQAYENTDGLRAIRVDYQKISEYNKMINEQKLVIESNMVSNDEYQSNLLNQINQLDNIPVIPQTESVIDYNENSVTSEITPEVTENNDQFAMNQYNNSPMAYDNTEIFKKLFELLAISDISEIIAITNYLEKHNNIQNSEGAIIHQFPNVNESPQNDIIQSKIS